MLPILTLLLGASLLAGLPLAALDGGASRAARTVEFTPRYPLWTDGLEKRRALILPAGSEVDRSDPDHWEFPRGTVAVKEFSRDGRRVETRTIERLADGQWRYLTYAWSADGTSATLAPAEGIPSQGIPSRDDCLACHEGAPSPILGYSAVQLETTLEPAVGYLHGNCGHCHNAASLPALKLELQQLASNPAKSTEATRASLARESRFRAHGKADMTRAGTLLARMQSNDPYTRMPPLGVSVIDAEGVALIERWIANVSPTPEK